MSMLTPQHPRPALKPKKSILKRPCTAGAGRRHRRIEQDELSQRMSQLLALLPDRQREILVLRVAIGLCAEETAHVLGITTAAVRVAQHRALVRLRKNLSATESL
jgi:RNA polymerase sigma factor (sigma-70 family)